jgi:hypothetical protein
MRTYNIGCEVSLVAYNGHSQRKSKRESYITGEVTKVTKDYIYIRDYRDSSIWKAPRNQA